MMILHSLQLWPEQVSPCSSDRTVSASRPPRGQGNTLCSLASGIALPVDVNLGFTYLPQWAVPEGLTHATNTCLPTQRVRNATAALRMLPSTNSKFASHCYFAPSSYCKN